MQSSSNGDGQDNSLSLDELFGETEPPASEPCETTAAHPEILFGAVKRVPSGAVSLSPQTGSGRSRERN